MFHNKGKFWLLDLVMLKLVMKHTLRSLLMVLKQDLCRLNNTESFYILLLAMLKLRSVLLLLGKGFRPISMLIFVFYHYFLL